MSSTIDPKEKCHVCCWRGAYLIDNWFRQLLHRPGKLFGAYVQKGMRVLDVGCGRGFVSLGLARMVGRNGEVIAADLQPQMLEMVGRRAAKAGLDDRIVLHQCKSDRVGVTEECDFAVAFWMVHETPDPDGFLKEIYGILSPSGRFFIAEPKMHLSKSQFDQTLEQARSIGFQVECVPSVSLSHAVVLSKQ